MGPESPGAAISRKLPEATPNANSFLTFSLRFSTHKGSTSMSTAMEQFISTLKAARLVSTPLVVIRGPDSTGAIQTFQSSVLADPEECSLVHWDCMRGVQPINHKGKDLAAKHAKILYPAQALDAAQSFPEETILFISN